MTESVSELVLEEAELLEEEEVDVAEDEVELEVVDA